MGQLPDWEPNMGLNMHIVSQLGQNMHIVSRWKQGCQLVVLRDHVKRTDPGSNLVTVVPNVEILQANTETLTNCPLL